MRLLLTSMLLCLLSTLPLRAEIAGQDDPAFEAALELWLNDENMPALTALAALSKDGNRAAQVFLGIVEPATWLHGEVTSGMSRKDRNALLKAPGGLSGKSWLNIAAEDTPLAALFVQSKTPYRGPEIGTALIEAGEIGPGVVQIFNAINYGAYEDAYDMALMPQVLPITHGFMALYLQDMDQFSDRTPEYAARVAALGPVPPDQKAMWPPSDTLDWWFKPEQNKAGLQARGEAMAQHPMIVPIVAAIETVCDRGGAFEAAMLQGLMRRSPIALFSLSPVETLLPSDRYVASPRFRLDLQARVEHLDLREEWYLKTVPCIAMIK